MTRKPQPRRKEGSVPDHRPMQSVLRRPEDPLDTAVRSVRRRYDELNPADPLQWR